MRNKNRSGSAGFSLVELLTVVLLIGIMSAVAIPNIMTWIRTSKIRAAASEVASEMQTARARAIAKNVNYGVVFLVLSNTTYQWVIEDNLFGTSAWASKTFAQRAAIDGQAGTVGTLPLGVVFLAGNDAGLRFNRLGSPCDPGDSNCPDLGSVGWDGITNDSSDSTSIATVTLSQASTGLTRTVEVAPGGRVRVVQ